MKFLFLSVLAYLFLFSGLYAQKVSMSLGDGTSLEFRTKAAVLDSVLLKSEVAEYLTELGYYGFQLDSLTIKDSEAKVWGKSGPKYSVGTICVSSSQIDSVWTAKGFMGETANVQVIKRVGQHVIQYYEDQGYAAASLYILKAEVDDLLKLVHLNIMVNPGPRLVFAGLIDKTNGTLSKRYLERVVDTRPGDPISPDVLRKIENNLSQTEAYKRTYEPSLTVNGDEALVIIDYPERKLNSFDALIGYVPTQQDGNGAIVGNLNLRIRNIGIPGSTTRLRFDRLQPFVTKFWLDYDSDWLFGAPLSAQTNINLIQQDSTYLVRNFGLQTEIRVGMNHFLGLGFNNESAFSGNRTLEEGEFARVLDANRWMFGVSYRYRKLDSPVNPTRGVLFSMNADNGRKQITDAEVNPDSVSTIWNQILFRSSGRLFVPTFQRQTIALGAHLYLMDSPYYMEDDLTRFGGALSLRGFNEDQFFASQMFWADAEYRLLLDQESYGFVFGAFGNYERPRYFTEPEAVRRLNENLFSYGLGFSYQTRAGRLMFTYALSRQDGFSNGKVHVGIVGNL